MIESGAPGVTVRRFRIETSLIQKFEFCGRHEKIIGYESHEHSSQVFRMGQLIT